MYLQYLKYFALYRIAVRHLYIYLIVFHIYLGLQHIIKIQQQYIGTVHPPTHPVA